MSLTHPSHTRRLLVLLLVLAFVRGLIYATLIPLWHASDEPNHAEYVLFILRENQLPQPGDVAVDVRREILASRWENEGIDAIPGLGPGDLLGDNPPRIPGPSEFSHPPAYYLLMATMLRPLAHHDATTLAYAARFGSVLLGVISLGLTILAARVLFAGRPEAVWAAPLLVLFIPAHTFSNSTINNDQLAEVVMSAFFCLWLLVFQKGWSWKKAIGLVGVILLGLLTKRTTAISVSLSLMAAIMLAGRRLAGAERRWRWGVPLALMVIGVCMGAALLHPRGVGGWYTTGDVSRSNNVSKNGKHSMHFVIDPADESSEKAYQVLPTQTLETLRGQEVSFGVWVKGSRNSQVRLHVSDRHHQYRENVTVTDSWQFYHVAAKVSQNAPELRMTITAQASLPADVYVDDVSLLVVDGGGQNILYNGSAEQSAWMLRPWAKALAASLTGLRLDPNIIQGVLDIRETWRFRDVLLGIVDNLFKLFWAAFGVREAYVGQIWFYLLAGVHLFAGVGLVRAWSRHRRARWQAESLIFVLLAIIVASVAAIARGYPLGSMTFVPAGRYQYVIVVPYSLVMATGIGSWIPRRYHSLATMVGAALLISFDALCMFYYVIPRWYG